MYYIYVSEITTDYHKNAWNMYTVIYSKQQIKEYTMGRR